MQGVGRTSAHRPLTSVTLATVVLCLAGCGGPARKPTTKPPSLKGTASPHIDEEMRKEKLRDDRRVANAHTIDDLWTVMNDHHDKMGRLLAAVSDRPVDKPQTRGVETQTPRKAPLEAAHRRPRRGPRPDARPGSGPGPRPGPEPGPRAGARAPKPPRVETRGASRVRPRPHGDYRATQRRAHAAAGSLCRRICRHARAICRAAAKICTIADELNEPRAHTACARGRQRCQQAHAAARTRCPPCGGDDT